MEKLWAFMFKSLTRIQGGGKLFDVFWYRWIANGAEYIDVKRVMNRVASYDEWAFRWEEQAAKYGALGDEAVTEEDRRKFYLKASHYYYLAQWGIYTNNKIKRELLKKSELYYEKVIPLFDFEIESVELYSEGNKFKGYFYHCNKNVPTLLIIHGADSSKEELHIFAEEAVARGFNAMLIDGPGQGDALMERNIKMSFDSEKVYIKAVDYLEEHRLVPRGKIGVLGASYGGFWALKLAALDKRISACVSLGGPYRPAKAFMRRVPPPIKNAKNFLVDAIRLPKGGRKIAILTGIMVLIRLPHILGVSNLAEVKNVLPSFTLEGLEDMVDIPVLIVNGKADLMCPVDELQTLYDKLGSGDKEIKIFDDSDHCCTHLLRTEVRPYIWQWFKKKLA